MGMFAQTDTRVHRGTLCSQTPSIRHINQAISQSMCLNFSVCKKRTQSIFIHTRQTKKVTEKLKKTVEQSWIHEGRPIEVRLAMGYVHYVLHYSRHYRTTSWLVESCIGKPHYMKILLLSVPVNLMLLLLKMMLMEFQHWWSRLLIYITNFTTVRSVIMNPVNSQRWVSRPAVQGGQSDNLIRQSVIHTSCCALSARWRRACDL